MCDGSKSRSEGEGMIKDESSSADNGEEGWKMVFCRMQYLLLVVYAV